MNALARENGTYAMVAMDQRESVRTMFRDRGFDARADAQTWWRSASATIMAEISPEDEAAHPELHDFGRMVHDMFAAFDPGWKDPEVAMAAYERHNAAVRAEVPPERLVEWQPGDGWEPLATALGVAVPAEPFPHTNTTAEFQERRAAQP